MSGKLKLMSVVLVSAWLATTSGQNIGQQHPSPRLLIIGSYFSGDFGGAVERRYEVLRAFIVNYSNDTLKFWGTNCHPTNFFTVSNNNYMHLADEECKNSEFEQIAIPPHRSQLIPVKMLVEKQPHEMIRLNVRMKFYRYFQSGRFIEDSKNHQPEMLTDTITLKFNKNGDSYYTKADCKEQELKEKLNLPSTKLHLLTPTERRLYTITANETKIRKMANGEYAYANEKVFRIPVTVHNNSSKPLKYNSMSCSWEEFYHTDNKNFTVPMPPCEKNVPAEVIVPAHSTHTDLVPFVCNKRYLKTLGRFRIGLNINTDPYYNMLDGYDEESDKFNIVWSNEIQFTPK